MSSSLVAEDSKGNLGGGGGKAIAIFCEVPMTMETLSLTLTRTCPRNSSCFTSFSFHPVYSSYRNVGHSSAIRLWLWSSSSLNLVMTLIQSSVSDVKEEFQPHTWLDPSQSLQGGGEGLGSGLYHGDEVLAPPLSG